MKYSIWFKFYLNFTYMYTKKNNYNYEMVMVKDSFCCYRYYRISLYKRLSQKKA